MPEQIEFTSSFTDVFEASGTVEHFRAVEHCRAFPLNVGMRHRVMRWPAQCHSRSVTAWGTNPGALVLWAGPHVAHSVFSWLWTHSTVPENCRQVLPRDKPAWQIWQSCYILDIDKLGNFLCIILSTSSIGYRGTIESDCVTHWSQSFWLTNRNLHAYSSSLLAVKRK